MTEKLSCENNPHFDHCVDPALVRLPGLCEPDGITAARAFGYPFRRRRPTKRVDEQVGLHDFHQPVRRGPASVRYRDLLFLPIPSCLDGQHSAPRILALTRKAL